MSEPNDIQSTAKVAAAGSKLLKTVQNFNWMLLTALVAGAWFLYGQTLAVSILIGGLLANVSFFLLRRDIKHFMDTFSKAGGNWKEVKKLEKIKFFLKFYGRLAVLALILFLLVTQISINLIGLVIGLSTIMFSVIVIVLSKGSTLYSAEHLKGA